MFHDTGCKFRWGVSSVGLRNFKRFCFLNSEGLKISVGLRRSQDLGFKRFCFPNFRRSRDFRGLRILFPISVGPGGFSGALRVTRCGFRISVGLRIMIQDVLFSGGLRFPQIPISVGLRIMI